MTPVYLAEQESVDLESECTLSDISSIRNCYDKLHTHDYYEFLLVVEGEFIHYANGASFLQNEGTLIFFRPSDVHRILPSGEKECHLINVTYRKQTFEDLTAYMGEGFVPPYFFDAPYPPVFSLIGPQKQALLQRMEALNTIPGTEKKRIRAALRLLLLDLFYAYFHTAFPKSHSAIPGWLLQLCKDMKEKEHFTAGTAAMVHLSGKSHAYLCRMCKQHIHMTPTDFINSLRMNYARNLLLNSDRSIVEICYDVGFDSLGHFYQVFSRHFGMPPLHYRKKHWNSLHHWSC